MRRSEFLRLPFLAVLAAWFTPRELESEPSPVACSECGATDVRMVKVPVESWLTEPPVCMGCAAGSSPRVSGFPFEVAAPIKHPKPFIRTWPDA